MEVFISDFINEKLNYINSEEILDIYEIIGDYRTMKGILIQKNGKLNFKIQKGCKKHLIKLEDNKTYEYHIDEIEPIGYDQEKIQFMNLSESHSSCVFLFFDSKNSENRTLYIQSIMNNKDCIKSEDKNHKYKVGDILMQIIIGLVKTSKIFSHIKEIELTDISKKNCYNIGLELIYLRTITNGIPYYAKYGFIPKKDRDNKVFEYNKNNYKLNKGITKEEFINIIKKNKFEKDTYNIYKKYFNDYIEKKKNINPKKILKIIINTDKITDDINEKKEICNLVENIYKDIYDILGYKEYRGKKWILKIRD